MPTKVKVMQLRTHFKVFLLLIFLAFLFAITPSYVPPIGAAEPSEALPIHFYLHNDTSNPRVGGYTQTTATLNTSQKWREKPQGYENITGTLYLDFYVHPDLAANMSLSGMLWLHPWMCGFGTGGSTIKGVFKASIYEVTSISQTLVGSTQASGSMNLAYGSAPAHSRDVNSVAGNNPLTLSFPPYTFRKGSSILIHIEVVPQGAGATMFFYYDEGICPSYITLYSYDHVDVAEAWTTNATGYPTATFLAAEDSLVKINANVTDPLGGYDFNASSTQTKYAMVDVTVIDPNGTRVVENQRMTLIDGGITSFSNLLQYNWTFSTAIPGRYNVTVTVTDNSGNTIQKDLFFQIGQTYRIQIQAIDAKDRPLTGASVDASVARYKAFSDHTNSTGWIDRLIGSGTYNFTVAWQGVIVNSTLNFPITTNTTLVLKCNVYDPKFLVLDDVDSPLPEAQVYIEHPNGSTNILPLRTAENGFINLTSAPGGDYAFTILWKGVNVLQTIQAVGSDGPYTLKCQVYELTVNVLGKNGDKVHGAYVVIYTQAGIVYDFKMTDISGQAVFKLPVGTYRIEAHYSTAYWLTHVAVSATEPSVSVTTSSPLTITLPGFPPPIWTTIGFWLIIVFIFIAVLGAVYTLYKKGIIFKGRA